MDDDLPTFKDIIASLGLDAKLKAAEATLDQNKRVLRAREWDLFWVNARMHERN